MRGENMNFRNSGLLIFVLSGAFVDVPSQTFQWPVDNPKVTQIYACRKCPPLRSPRFKSGINFHSGVDVKPVDAGTYDYTKPAKAAADGWVEKIVEYLTSHGLGNTVILRHENGKYSLYGHLDHIDESLFPGAFVPQGSHLGVMGNSASKPRHQSGPDRFGTHVHFEIKDNPALGNIDDDHDYWGYTPGHPDLYNYHDPRHYVQDISVELITPTAVQNPPPGALNVRSGPGITYFVTDGGTVTYTYRTYRMEIRENQEFVAFKRTFVEGGYWYYSIY
jgi:murein DD-endopeptidase MepM/ murein hydrolase activator NlpD